MKISALILAAAFATAGGSAYAACGGPSAGGAVGGATAGAVGGAVVGGPVGAAAGAVVGGAVGSVAIPEPACQYVLKSDVPVVTYQGEVIVGKPLPETVVLHPIPQYETYVFARVNGQRVIVDPRTRVVLEVVAN